MVSRETIRKWVNRFGGHFANCIRRDRPSAADKWHLDEVVIPINGRKCWLWRAVDAKGDTLDILVQPRRNAKAARRFLKRLISQFGQPRVVITPSRDIAFAMHCRAMDKLRSYFKPIRDLAPGADHRAHKGLNNRIEGSHRPTRKHEKLPLIVCLQTTAGQRMGRSKSPRQAERFLAAHDQINTVFRPRRYQLSTASYRHTRTDAFDLWEGYALEMTA